MTDTKKPTPDNIYCVDEVFAAPDPSIVQEIATLRTLTSEAKSSGVNEELIKRSVKKIGQMCETMGGILSTKAEGSRDQLIYLLSEKISLALGTKIAEKIKDEVLLRLDNLEAENIELIPMIDLVKSMDMTVPALEEETINA